MRHGCHGASGRIGGAAVLGAALAASLWAPPARADQAQALESCRAVVVPELRHDGKPAVALELDEDKVVLETAEGSIGEQPIAAVLSAPGEIRRPSEPAKPVRLICLLGPGDSAVFAHLVPTEPPSALDVCYGRSAIRLDVAPCLEAALAAAERDLADRLAAARKEAADLDRVTGRTHTAAALEASQRAWLAYRDEECHRRAALVAGGTGEGDIGLACRVDVTSARAAELRP